MNDEELKLIASERFDTPPVAPQYSQGLAAILKKYMDGSSASVRNDKYNVNFVPNIGNDKFKVSPRFSYSNNGLAFNGGDAKYALDDSNDVSVSYNPHAGNMRQRQTGIQFNHRF